MNENRMEETKQEELADETNLNEDELKSKEILKSEVETVLLANLESELTSDDMKNTTETLNEPEKAKEEISESAEKEVTNSSKLD